MRVVIAEDSVLLREGVTSLLVERGVEVVGSVDTVDDLLALVHGSSPDAAIVDIRLPPTHSDEGIRATLQIREEHRSVGVLVLSQYVELGLALKLLAGSAEGVGYLLKDRISDVKGFVAAVERVASGGWRSTRRSCRDCSLAAAVTIPSMTSHPAEPEVLELMATGTSNQGIADKMVISLPRSRSTCPASSPSSACHRAVANRARSLAVLLYLRT